ncbi:MAG: hypothetical protein GY718_10465 [Lentisphaerae bacterium]|nr:hypothetical protein [Lentisphaerota bacterium]
MMTPFVSCDRAVATPPTINPEKEENIMYIHDTTNFKQGLCCDLCLEDNCDDCQFYNRTYFSSLYQQRGG